MHIQVDIWTGPGHQRHSASEQFSDYGAAFSYAQQHIEAGAIANMLDISIEHEPASDNTELFRSLVSAVA